MDTTLLEIKAFGHDQGAGNILALQPWMERGDYASAEAFAHKLTAYLQQAQTRHWLTSKTILLLPEHIATWLVAASESERVYTATTTAQAFGPIARRNWIRFLLGFFNAKARDRATAALFIAKAPDMARIYNGTFSALAKRFHISIVAGSILLPDPKVVDGRVKSGRGPLQNVSAFFDATGTVAPNLVRKIYPIETELPFTKGAELSSLPVFSTPLGRVGVLICADAWYPQTYDRLDRLAAEVILVPSYLNPDDVWNQAWRGYNGAPPPPGVDAGDQSRLSEGQAWEKYALAGRLRDTTARAGVNVFLRGNLWDLGSDGHTIAQVGSNLHKGANVKGAALHNFWLPSQ